MRLPLQDIRIIDLSHWWAGPYATMNLAALGAQVIKVESIQHLDGYRGGYSAKGVKPWEAAPTFLAFNLAKLDVTLDLTREPGRALLLRLVRVADVILDNYSARVMDNFGLGYEVLRRENPGIIAVSMPGFGKSGPWVNYTGFAFNLEQLSGIAHHTGFADGPPSNVGAAADPIMGMYGSFAVLAALEARNATGQGQFIDLAHIEAMTAFSAGPVLDYQLNERVPMRTGNRHPTAAPHSFYPCKGTDQWIAIACYGEEDWRRLVTAMGSPAWASDTHYADELSRWKHQDELDRRIGEWTAGLEKREAMRRLQEAGVAAGAASNAADLLADPHLNARRMQQELDHPFAGGKPYPRLPYLIDGEPLRWAAAAPTVGQHNADILRGLLGLPERELRRLEQDKIIGYGPLGVESASK